MKKKFGPLLGAILVAAGTPAIARPTPSAPVTVHVIKVTEVDPTSLALAHQILAIAFPPEKRSDVFASVMETIIDQSRKEMEGKVVGDKDFQAILDRSMVRMYAEMKTVMNAALPDYFESFARAYARDFSREDLEAILTFAKTPAGQRYFTRAPGLLKDPDVQAATQRMMSRLLTKMPEITQETRREIEDYVAKKAKQEKAAAPTPVS